MRFLQAIFIDLCLSLDDLEKLHQSLSLSFTAVAQLTSFEESQHVWLRKLYQAALKLAGFLLDDVVKLRQGVLVDLTSAPSRELNISLRSGQVDVGGELLTVIFVTCFLKFFLSIRIIYSSLERSGLILYLRFF